MSTKKNVQAGFTLIEIIAVLVILGILAAVAIPKYQSLQAEAGRSAARGGISAAQGALTMKVSQQLLASPNLASFACTDVTAADMSLQGITVALAQGTGNDCNITATHTGSGETATGSWEAPL